MRFIKKSEDFVESFIDTKVPKKGYDSEKLNELF